MTKLIQISPLDNVAVALHPVAKGEEFAGVAAAEDIPQGHKMALRPIANGENVIKYGFPIGHAIQDIAPGAWVHVHNTKTNLSEEGEYTYEPAVKPVEPETPETFMGFVRDDGRAAIRNEIWVIPTVGCVNGVAQKLCRDNQHLV